MKECHDTIISLSYTMIRLLDLHVHNITYNSISEHCKKQLDDYVLEKFTNVKVIHAAKREGLIRTKLLGAKAATGDVLIFLDSHCESNINWLPPLLGKTLSLLKGIRHRLRR